MRRVRLGATAVLGAALLAGSPVMSTATPASLPVALEPGFTVVSYAATGGTPSSLAFGPDTRDGESGARLYVTDNSGGAVVAIDDVGGVGSPPTVFGEGFRSPVGVLAA